MLNRLYTIIIFLCLIAVGYAQQDERRERPLKPKETTIPQEGERHERKNLPINPSYKPKTVPIIEEESLQKEGTRNIKPLNRVEVEINTSSNISETDLNGPERTGKSLWAREQTEFNKTDSAKFLQKTNNPNIVMVAPANDNCANAINLGTISTTTTVAGTNVGATYDVGYPSCFDGCCVVNAATNVWYKFTIPAGGGNYSFVVAGGTIAHPDVAVWQFSPTACSIGSTIENGCKYYTTATTTTLNINCMAAGTYYIYVDDDYYSCGACTGTQGTFNLTVTQTSAGSVNDNCSSAIDLGSVSTTTTTVGSNVCASADLWAPACWRNTYQNVWYKFTVPSSGTYTVNVKGAATMGPEVGIITMPTACSLTGATELVCGGYYDGTGTASSITVNPGCLGAGVYYIAVDYDAYDGGIPGTFSITVTRVSASAAPTNDLCANASIITLAQNATVLSYTGTATGFNTCAGSDGTLPSGFGSNAHNVWYKFQAPVAGGYYADVRSNSGTMTYPMISVSTGTCGASPTGYGGDASVTGQPTGYYSNNYSYGGICSATANQWVYIQVDNSSSSGTQGTFSVNVATLKNDALTQPLIIDACGTNFSSSTIGATNCGNCSSDATNTSGDNLYNNLDCNTSSSDQNSSGGSCSGTPCGYVYDGGTSGFYGDVPYSVENDSWYEFCVTQASTVTLTFQPTAGTCYGPTTSLQMSIFKGFTNALTYVAGAIHNGVAAGSVGTYTYTLATSDCSFIEVDGFAGTNCDYTLQANILPSCVLPVKMLYFNAMLTDKLSVKLNWATETEENANYFLIEKSADGLNYTKLPEVKAKGNSTSLLNYSTYDYSPIKGHNVYRLICFDKNGERSFFGYTTVTNNGGLSFFNLYPNPAQNSITLSLNNFSTPTVSYELYDAQGRLIKIESIDLVDGSIDYQLNLSELNKGIFFIKLSNGETIYKKTFIKSE
jgi:hypothetical protein